MDSIISISLENRFDQDVEKYFKSKALFQYLQITTKNLTSS